jgi:hypothetical protein
MHADEDEFSFVVKGKVGARIEDQIAIAGPGSYILKPRNIPHTSGTRDKRWQGSSRSFHHSALRTSLMKLAICFGPPPEPEKLKELAA